MLPFVDVESDGEEPRSDLEVHAPLGGVWGGPSGLAEVVVGDELHRGPAVRLRFVAGVAAWRVTECCVGEFVGEDGSLLAVFESVSEFDAVLVRIPPSEVSAEVDHVFHADLQAASV